MSEAPCCGTCKHWEIRLENYYTGEKDGLCHWKPPETMKLPQHYGSLQIIPHHEGKECPCWESKR